MPDTPTQNQFYQAPLEVNTYVNPNIAPIPQMPNNLYDMFGVIPAKKTTAKVKSPYEMMMDGTDPFSSLMPDVAPLQTNLATLKPLDDPAGLFHSQDGFGKYGYSSILHGGDNEDRYAQNFRRDNPSLFGFGVKSSFYWGLGFLEKTLESAVVKTGQGFSSLYGMTIGNSIDLGLGKRFGSFDEWLTSSTDNIFSQAFDGWDEKLKERYHYFQEKNDREKKGFIQSLGDGDFWMNDISDGLGFLVSAAFEVGLISKLGLGTKVASRIAPLAEGVSTSALRGSQAASRGMLQSTLNKLGIEGTGNAFVKNAVDLTSQTLATVSIEAAVEANEAKKKIYESFDGKVNPETGYYYTTEEKERLAAAGAAEVFRQNMAILAGPKFLETLVFNKVGKYVKGLTNKAFGQAQTEAGKASNRVRSKLGNLSSGASYEKASALKNTWKVGSLAAVGFMSEGLFEENIQLAISRSAEDKFSAKDEFFRPGTSEKDVETAKQENALFGNVGNRYMRQTKQFFAGVKDDRFIDDELSKSVGIGGLFGVGGGGITGFTQNRQQAKVDIYWAKRLNEATANLFEGQDFFLYREEERPDPNNPGKTKPTPIVVTDPKTGQPVMDQNKVNGYLNKMANIDGILDIIRNTEDPTDENNKSYQNKELNKLARNVLFTKLAMEYVRAGKKDLLLSMLTSTSQFSDKDIQALGYESGFMTADQKKQMLAKMTNIVNRISVADEWIENNVLDNVSEPREAKFGLAYSKAQKAKRREEFEKKKAYLRDLAMQNALLDSYLDDITEAESKLGEPAPELTYMTANPEIDGITPVDFNKFNSRIPAIENMISILEKEFAHYWEDLLTKERNSPKAAEFNIRSKSNNGQLLAHSLIKSQEALEKINELQAELDELNSKRGAFLQGNDNFELRQEDDGSYYLFPKQQEKTGLEFTLDQLDANKQRRLNEVKREEIGIQKGWIEEEWKNTAALKEEKTKAGREETYFSRRMSLSTNAYNTYFQREVMDKDNSAGQRRLKLYDKDPNKLVTAKKYKSNEEKLLKAIRIQGKVQTILAEVNGQKLLAEIQSLLERDLSGAEFSNELKIIVDEYNGKPMVLPASDKNLVDEQISDTQDEYSFVTSIFEYMPEDDRFNSKYYNIGVDGEFVVKPQYDSLQDLASAARELQERIDDLNKIKKFLDSIPESIPGDWNNVNRVKRRIADVYTESADGIINNYNQLSNNGQSEYAGDSLNTKQELDKVEEEINELGQLKAIFEERTASDKILSTPEFEGFIEGLDKRIEDLKKIKEIIKERLSSRLRENQDFLIDTVAGIVEQLGLSLDGTTINQTLQDAVEKIATPEVFSKLKVALNDLKTLMEKEEQTAEDKKAISDAYWNINGQVAGILEVVKRNNPESVKQEIATQKAAKIKALEGTALMQKIKSEVFYKDVLANINDSVFGALQLVFYNTGSAAPFSQIGLGGADANFLDDQASSPIYKFREDFNLRKLIRNVDKDNTRTPENTEVSKEALQEFLAVIRDIKNLEDLESSLDSTLNMLDQIEKEKEVVQAKIDKKDNKWENLIVSSIQQLFFIRNVASFLKRKTGGKGFSNWTYIQAPGGAGKTQTLGTWFNVVSGIPRDKVLATAFTEEASRGIKKALLVGETGPKDVYEMIDYINELINKKDFSQDVLIIDEFPAIDVKTQKGLFDAVSKYTELKLAENKGEFKVVAMGDTNQLTFNQDGSVSGRPTIIVNPTYFGAGNHPAKMNIIPSLTVNFRTNLFAITSFVDLFKGSNKDLVNANIKVVSTNPNLDTANVKGVVSLDKGSFPTKVLDYLRNTKDSIKTRVIIVNESKIDSYKKMLTDNGIALVTDPNDEVTKGVYVSTVKNVQGFSFDEVFIDLENKDKQLFTDTANPDFVYNKAMYVAASRARDLIVVTNFSNFENNEDATISTLENKALEELRTKDEEFISNRDQEINGGKAILGDSYNKTVVSATPVKAEPKVETVLDPEEPKSEEDQEDEDIDEEAAVADKIEDEVTDDKDLEDETDDTTEERLEDNVVATDGIEDQVDGEISEKSDKTLPLTLSVMADAIKDKAVKAYTKVRSEVIELLFPTGQAIKYKVASGTFSTKAPADFESRDLRADDKIMLIPFTKKGGKSNRKFGYAIISPNIDPAGDEIPNSFKTVAVLSDAEIDKLKEKPETREIYNIIEENEKRDASFVSISYDDVSSENGFETGSNKIINPLEEGIVVHANPVKYYYKDTFTPLNKSVLEDVIDKFVNNYYKNHLDSFPSAERAKELKKIKDFYANSSNAQIIIPTNKDLIETANRKPRLNVPSDLKPFIKVGRPYVVFKLFHARGTMQFVTLSRKYLNTKEHNTQLAPIRDFIVLGKEIKKLMERKGIKKSLGYSKTLSNVLSKVAFEYLRNPNPVSNQVEVSYNTNEDGGRVTKKLTFTMAEAERIYNFYSMYSQPNTKKIEAKTEKEILNLTKIKRARNFTFEDGETIYGVIESYDPATKSFVVLDYKDEKKAHTKSGVISHTGKSYVGAAQEALDDIMNSNGSVASKFLTKSGQVGFVTSKSRTAKDVSLGYKFMALLGSKAAPVPKSYNSDGSVKEYYDDVIEILEDLFNFAAKGEMPGKVLNYIDEEGATKTLEAKFRVPVPINARNEAGELEHDFTFSPQNTSRDTSIPNAKYFESNFDTLLASRVFIQFGEKTEEQEEKQEQPETTEEVKETIIEVPKQDVKTLTKDEINSLSFKEIRDRLTPDQVKTLDTWAKLPENGFDNIDHFFAVIDSTHPEEQDIFRDYIIECIL